MPVGVDGSSRLPRNSDGISQEGRGAALAPSPGGLFLGRFGCTVVEVTKYINSAARFDVEMGNGDFVLYIQGR